MTSNFKPTETLAKLYEAQKQYIDSLLIYKKLIEIEPSAEYKEKIAKLKENIFDKNTNNYREIIQNIFSAEELKSLNILNHQQYLNYKEAHEEYKNLETYPEEMLEGKLHQTEMNSKEKSQNIEEETSLKKSESDSSEIIEDDKINAEQMEKVDQLPEDEIDNSFQQKDIEKHPFVPDQNHTEDLLNLEFDEQKSEGPTKEIMDEDEVNYDKEVEMKIEELFKKQNNETQEPLENADNNQQTETSSKNEDQEAKQETPTSKSLDDEIVKKENMEDSTLTVKSDKEPKETISESIPDEDEIEEPEVDRNDVEDELIPEQKRLDASTEKMSSETEKKSSQTSESDDEESTDNKLDKELDDFFAEDEIEEITPPEKKDVKPLKEIDPEDKKEEIIKLLDQLKNIDNDKIIEVLSENIEDLDNLNNIKLSDIHFALNLLDKIDE